MIDSDGAVTSGVRDVHGCSALGRTLVVIRASAGRCAVRR